MTQIISFKRVQHFACRPPGLPHDNLRAKTSTFEVPTDQNTEKNSTRRSPEREKNENGGWEKEKKVRNFGAPHPSGPHQIWVRASTLRAPTFSCVWIPTPSPPLSLRAPTLRAPKPWPHFLALPLPSPSSPSKMPKTDRGQNR